MDKITKNPGVQHLAKKVFWNLDVEDSRICAQINPSCQQILQNPIFCLRKFKHLSTENKKDWLKHIQLVKNYDIGIAVISYLRWKLKKEPLVDLPCYTSPAVQDDSRKRIREICEKWESFDEDLETVKILASLTDNPNVPDKNVGQQFKCLKGSPRWLEYGLPLNVLICIYEQATKNQSLIEQKYEKITISSI